MEELQNKMLLLAKIARALNRNDITWAVGASMMLYFRNVIADFHDIDIMIADADIDRAKAELEKMGELQPAHPNVQYNTAHFYEFIVEGMEVDMIAGFAIVKDGVTYSCPLTMDTIDGSVEVKGERVPLQSLAAWRRYYALMGRAEKVQMIDDAL